MKKPKLEKHSYHEFLDRSNLIGDMLDKYLIHHPVTKLNPPINKKLNEATTNLFEAYHMVSELITKNESEKS